MSNKYYAGGNPPFKMHTYKRKRTRDEQQMDERRSMGREERDMRSHIRLLMSQMDAIKAAVLKKDGTFKEYGSVRNTAGGGPILMGEPDGPMGPPGPPGAQGPRGLTGFSGTNGLDGNADFMLLESVPTGSNELFSGPAMKIQGSLDMLADHRCIRSRGTSVHVYNGNHEVQTIALLFKPGIYKVTLSSRTVHVDERAFGFDDNHNHLISYMNGGAEDFAIPPNAYSGSTVTRIFEVKNNTNFYFVERTNSSYSDTNGHFPQMLFEKIGYIEETGTDDTLHGYLGVPVINTQPINGGLYWGTQHTAPPAGYHPNDHPSNGGSNEWAVIELAAETAQAQFGWIHRVKRFI